MRLLKYIEDKPYKKSKNTWKRFASRAVAFDKDDQIPLEFVSKYNYHKLPGGGINDNESKLDACKREVNEETGCQIEIVKEVGRIEEYRSELDFYQTSYCYIGNIIVKGLSHWEPDEIEEGHQLVWMALSEAINTLRNDNPENYEGKFIQQRDLVFLKEVKRLIS